MLSKHKYSGYRTIRKQSPTALNGDDLIPIQRKHTEFSKSNLVKEKIIKQADKAESIRLFNYLCQAIEEIMVNCLYHRYYQLSESVEIRIYPDSIIFINQGGPDRSIRLDTCSQGKVYSRRYRNRRLGEFLKRLKLTEGRATGIFTLLKALNEPKTLCD
ncbi:MAG: hypothetical protein M0R31_10245 [Candidatus Riflebacteria bacterium]|jgi:ATP-dependent DNA helicase RecG|nr:hypothetical protein [Candidatus Riflebacteria bacterium]MDD3701373.1 ATP-binding protein [Bacteroidales bacterium]MDY0370579.1 ATP-binding protein [Bacteroidales bacterium]